MKVIIDEPKIEALAELLEFCSAGELRNSVMHLFFYFVSNIEKEKMIPLNLSNTTDNIQFLIEFLEKLEDNEK